MNRRDFLRSTGVFSASLTFARAGRLFAKSTTDWRTFEVATRVEVLKTSGTTSIWLPMPLTSQIPCQKTLSVNFHAEGGTAKTIENNPDALGIIVAEFPSGVKPVLTLTSRVTTKTYVVDLSARSNSPKDNRADLEHFLQPTKLLPTDGDEHQYRIKSNGEAFERVAKESQLAVS